MPEQLLQISYSLSNIKNVVHQLWQYAHQYHVWTFNGEMGAGKTTLIHALCDELGVTDAVSSPTFALINEYHFINKEGADTTIYHMDWYRLKDEEEALNAGMEDAIQQPGAYSWVEWAEKAASLIPYPHIQIDIVPLSPEERVVTIWLMEHAHSVIK
jgi:tRNA threonylcarbamoyladenosine biosynthesis protein TsaE